MTNPQTFAEAFATVPVPLGIDDDLVQDHVEPVQIPPGIFLEDTDEIEVLVPVQEPHQNVLTIEALRDGIIASKTYKSYLGDISALLQWALKNQNDWVTTYGNTKLAEVYVWKEDEGPRLYKTRTLIELKVLLRDAYDNNIIHLDAISPARYMDFVLTLTGCRGRKFLTPSAYNNKRSAFNHLFRLHNRVGFLEPFSVELGNLFKGLFRTITQQNHVVGTRMNDDNELNNNNVAQKQHDGKEAMSIELYKSLCGWLLSYGTNDGVFAYTYLILSWNLACRAANTANIRLKDIGWSTCFDSYFITFAHSKTDQLGEESSYMRH